MASSPSWMSIVGGISKAIGLVAVINGALIIMSDPATPLGGMARGVWTGFFETYQDCIENSNGSLTENNECRIKFGF